jgi:hypothetical protein
MRAEDKCREDKNINVQEGRKMKTVKVKLSL